MVNRLFFVVASGALLLAVATGGPAPAHDGVVFGCDPEGPFGVPGVTGPTDQIGEWAPYVPVLEEMTHVNVLHNGKVLWWREGEFLGTPTESFVWDPVADTHTMVRAPSTEIFCAGHANMADGRILAAGGSSNVLTGIHDANIFDPLTETWTRVADMAWGRYYPTVTLLPDGRLVVLSGTLPEGGGIAPIPEIYDPATNTWTEMLDADTTPGATYPSNFVGPDGNIVFTGPTFNTQTLDMTLGQWVLNLDWATYHNVLGTNVLYRPGKVLKVGGVSNGVVETGEMVNFVELIDLNDPVPTWVDGSPIQWPRGWINMVVLPDGKVLLVGGATGGGWHHECAVMAPEMWDPDTGLWTQMASHQRPREYHSTAFLLPDGRVVAGGGENQDTGGEKNYEIYSPPYLFKGPRPTVTRAPGAIAYGDTFSVLSPQAVTIASVALIRPATTTHQFDESQRFVPLSFTAGGSTLTLDAPPDGATAPPGYYMLFLVDNLGVPSVAEFVLMGDCTAVEPTEASCADGDDNDCDGLTDAADLDCGPNALPFAPSGAVPDGAAVAGQALTVAKMNDGLVRLDWGASCSAADVDYAIYEGSLGDFTDHEPVFCSTGGATTRTFGRYGDVYWLVVPGNGIREGRYGSATAGPRPQSALPCLPQEAATCN